MSYGVSSVYKGYQTRWYDMPREQIVREQREARINGRDTKKQTYKKVAKKLTALQQILAD